MVTEGGVRSGSLSNRQTELEEEGEMRSGGGEDTARVSYLRLIKMLSGTDGESGQQGLGGNGDVRRLRRMAGPWGV